MITEDVEQVILRLLGDVKPGASISPADVARQIAGTHPDAWSGEMPRVRRAIASLVGQGRIEAIRKGQLVDPSTVKGVYRLRLPLIEDVGKTIGE